jgi:hypothetical protein
MAEMRWRRLLEDVGGGRVAGGKPGRVAVVVVVAEEVVWREVVVKWRRRMVAAREQERGRWRLAMGSPKPYRWRDEPPSDGALSLHLPSSPCTNS